ncbi:MAG: 4'-phosphopantetheinyl transferase superfamily protein [Myxococcota bacterium]
MFEGLMPAAVVVREGRAADFGNPVEQLFAVEAALVAKAVAKRRDEFAVARILARRGVVALGGVAEPIPKGDRGEPVWPHGYVGSITHAAGRCAAAVARSESVRALGIDAEDDSPLSDAVAPVVCSAAERQWLATRPNADRGWLGKVIFSAKESVYKLQYPLTRTFLDFDAVEIAVDQDAGSWRATFRVAAGDRFAVGHTIEGVWAHRDAMVATAAWLVP